MSATHSWKVLCCWKLLVSHFFLKVIKMYHDKQSVHRDCDFWAMLGHAPCSKMAEWTKEQQTHCWSISLLPSFIMVLVVLICRGHHVLATLLYCACACTFCAIHILKNSPMNFGHSEQLHPQKWWHGGSNLFKRSSFHTCHKVNHNRRFVDLWHKEEDTILNKNTPLIPVTNLSSSDGIQSYLGKRRLVLNDVDIEQH